MITADIVLDSINGAGDRLTTFKLKYPHIIHPQLLMHRAFSRSCSSSRAIPTQTLIGEIMKHPDVFQKLATNKPGMQPGELLNEEDHLDALQIIDEHRNFSILCAQQLAKMGLHKQWANRILETHSHISVVLTATSHPGSLDNYFSLRCSEEAQAEIEVLAMTMRDCLEESVPIFLTDGEWHVPFVTGAEKNELEPQILLDVSAARCARTSYNKHDNSAPVIDEDRVLAHRLRTSRHSNPFEHQAQAHSRDLGSSLCGNFAKGWHQYRKVLERSRLI
jgi:hypothetical protein